MKKLMLFLVLACSMSLQAAVVVGPSMGQARVFTGASSTAGVFLVDQYGIPVTLPSGGQAQTVYNAVEYAYLTKTAGGTTPSGGSQTAVAVTGTVYTNVTTAAGYNGPCQVCIYPGNGPGAAFYYLISPNSTWLAPSTPLAVSTTPVCKNVGPGAHLFLSATAAAVTVNATVQYMPIQP